jgi:hypothetical protein
MKTGAEFLNNTRILACMSNSGLSDTNLVYESAGETVERDSS